MAEAIRRQVDEWNNDGSVDAMIITGAGRGFCAGANVGVWRDQIAASDGSPLPSRTERPETWLELFMRSKPVIAAVNGPAAGAGLTMTLGADVRIASEKAQFAMRFVRMGLTPELASTHLLAHFVGMGNAMELMLTGRVIDAEYAFRVGLVSRVVKHESLLDEATQVAEEIGSNPPESIRAIKDLAWSNLDNGDLQSVLAAERAQTAAARQRPYFKEAVRAFFEKREPDFLGVRTDK
jgi:enoyl-CoA hydratase/carnithine racemase